MNKMDIHNLDSANSGLLRQDLKNRCNAEKGTRVIYREEVSHRSWTPLTTLDT